MKLLKIVSRIVLGPLFIFSGFVKALDPLGSSYKFSDYFTAFGLEFLDGLSLPLGIFLASFEFVLGLVILLGYQKRITYWALLVFMSFFTLLTFILALTNPVTDCGCFGDAIIMTNWQTFFKNIIFMVFVLILFRSRKWADNVLPVFAERSLIVIFFAGIILFSVYCNKHLPVIDFRPYDVGTLISEEMKVPEGAPVDEYKTVLFYKNLDSGDTEEFTIENYPRDTTEYAFVTSESKLVKKGYEPPIHDFGIIDPFGYDITNDLLEEKDYSLMMISYNLERANQDILQEANAWAKMNSVAGDFKFIPVTSSPTTVKDEISSNLALEYDFYTADEIMLKTVIRSNPGFVLLKNGTIVAKWASRDFPSLDSWNSEWPEIVEQFAEQQDPEILQLIEEGFMDEMNLDLIEFDRSANKVVSTWKASGSDKNTWTIMIFSVLFLLTILQLLPKKENSRRV